MNSKSATFKTGKEKEESNELVLSYMTLRNMIGFSGFLLPLYLIIFTIVTPNAGDLAVQGSMSDYYWTSSGDVFVLVLCTPCVFLFAYAGYNWKERLLCYLAAIGGFGVAFDPTKWKEACKISLHSTDPDRNIIMFPGTEIEIHFIFAGLFLICLAIMSIKFFPLTTPGETVQKGTKKAKRNRIYKICGWIMIASVVGCILEEIFYDQIVAQFGKQPIIFLFEAIALFAFSTTWLTKGETLYPDGEHYFVTGYKMMKQSLKKNNQSTLDLKDPK
jgi:hypothetical protein